MSFDAKRCKVERGKIYNCSVTFLEKLVSSTLHSLHGDLLTFDELVLLLKLSSCFHLPSKAFLKLLFVCANVQSQIWKTCFSFSRHGGTVLQKKKKKRRRKHWLRQTRCHQVTLAFVSSRFHAHTEESMLSFPLQTKTAILPILPSQN